MGGLSNILFGGTETKIETFKPETPPTSKLAYEIGKELYEAIQSSKIADLADLYNQILLASLATYSQFPNYAQLIFGQVYPSFKDLYAQLMQGIGVRVTPPSIKFPFISVPLPDIRALYEEYLQKTKTESKKTKTKESKKETPSFKLDDLIALAKLSGVKGPGGVYGNISPPTIPLQLIPLQGGDLSGILL